MSAKKKRQQRQTQIIIWLIFLPFLLFGIFLLGLAADMIRSHLAALSWPPVTATLVASYAEHSSEKNWPCQPPGWQVQLCLARPAL